MNNWTESDQRIFLKLLEAAQFITERASSMAKRYQSDKLDESRVLGRTGVIEQACLDIRENLGEGLDPNMGIAPPVNESLRKELEEVLDNTIDTVLNIYIT